MPEITICDCSHRGIWKTGGEYVPSKSIVLDSEKEFIAYDKNK